MRAGRLENDIARPYHTRHAASLLLAIATLLFLALPRTALAATLTSIKIATVADGVTRVSFTFSDNTPNYHVDGDGTDGIAIAFAGSVESSTFRSPGVAGLIDRISVNVGSTPPRVIVNLHLTHAARVVANLVDVTLTVDIAREAAEAYQATNEPSPGNKGSSLQDDYVVPLQYADVSEVAGVLVEGAQVLPTDNFSPSGSVFALPTSANGGSQIQSSQSIQGYPTQGSFGQRVSEHVAIDRRLNAVILSGTNAEVALMKSLIAQMDVPQRSVILEAQIIELSDSSAADLGLDFTGGSTEIASAGASLSTGGLAQFNVHLQAALYDTIAKGGGKILASPRILALSGSAAQILTGDALPIITTTTFPGPPVTTQQAVTYISVGVNLQIQPRIAEDGEVTSHIFAEVSSVTAFVPTQQGNVPQISLREAATMATVRDSEPFVIGGLLKDEEIRNLSKVPGAGDLPLIGSLFRTRHDTGTRSNLYIIVIPHIVRPQGNPPPSGLDNAKGPGVAPY